LEVSGARLCQTHSSSPPLKTVVVIPSCLIIERSSRDLCVPRLRRPSSVAFVLMVARSVVATTASTVPRLLPCCFRAVAQVPCPLSYAICVYILSFDLITISFASSTIVRYRFTWKIRLFSI